jgi:hypothetical protein
VSVVAEVAPALSPADPLLRNWLETAVPGLAGRPVLVVGEPYGIEALTAAGATIQFWDETDHITAYPAVVLINYLRSLPRTRLASVTRRLAGAVRPPGRLLVIEKSLLDRSRDAVVIAAGLTALREAGFVLETYEDLDGSAAQPRTSPPCRCLRAVFRRFSDAI